MFSNQPFQGCSYSDRYGEVNFNPTLPIVIPLVTIREQFFQVTVSGVRIDTNSVSLTLDLFLPY